MSDDPEIKIVKIKNSEILRRRILQRWVREDGTIEDEAFKPTYEEKEDGAELEDSISVDADSLSTKGVPRFNRGKKIFSTCVILAEIPNNLDYTVIHKPEDKNYAHCGINNDMEQLLDDEDSLMTLAHEAELAFHPPNPSLVKAS